MKAIFRIFTTSAFGVCLLAACSSQQQGTENALATVAPPPQEALDNLNGKCGGENGVRVRPCPVKLTNASQKVVVTISGPGVASGSYLGSCYDFCSITILGHHKPTKWQIVPGASCGKAGLLFQGLTRGYIVVGNADLTIVNKSC